MNQTQYKSKKCNALTKANKKCSKSIYFFWYCKQHWRIKLFSWWGLFWGSIIAVTTFFGFYVDGKEVIYDIDKATNPEPNYWYCEQDKNIRGLILSGVFTNPERAGPLKIRTGGSKVPGIGPITIDYRKSYLVDGYFCFDSQLAWVKKFCSFKYRISEQGKLLITAKMYDTSGCIVGSIVDNEFLINVDCQFTWNMDETAFEVVGNDFIPVLSIEYVNPDILAIQGVFYDIDRYIIIGRGLIGSADINNKEMIDYGKKSIEAIFQYHGKDWFGKRKI